MFNIQWQILYLSSVVSEYNTKTLVFPHIMVALNELFLCCSIIDTTIVVFV